MNSPAAARHLSRAALAEYLATSAAASIVVPGNPICRIIFDPSRLSMSLRTPHDGGRIDLVDFENVDARLVADSGSIWSELTVIYRDHGHEAYLLLSDVADMIQQNHLPFASAVRAALTTFEELLARATGLSRERQIGLYGELLFLEASLQQLPASTAVGAWRGFGRSEHDFVLPDVSFEVKTTTTEKRRHRIGGLEQLVPNPGTALWFVSIQLTSAGGPPGRTLGDLVGDVVSAAGPAAAELESALVLAGWRERDRPRYRDWLTLRTVPASYVVDAGFPALSRRTIDLGCSRPELIVDASYTIDVTSLAKGTPPAPASLFVEGDN
ncbi:PD-(D/E)XK motif protein [Pseudonocardia sp. RS11V-5]|uniref:PD-(D/E)XK motif protein n=1 Tax=Pseudonocardia terrae TaxID=2905831 RepID=UPI001E538AD9|nr:PD-(D/E)XK motif protein [Pseudonocardia terrae]MCE3556525.1 PD-(D/E)XK motif protein [Pseudonocardia terrae]